MLHSLRVAQVEQTTHLGIKREEKNKTHSRKDHFQGWPDRWVAGNTVRGHISGHLGFPLQVSTSHQERRRDSVDLSGHLSANAQNRSDSFGSSRLAGMTINTVRDSPLIVRFFLILVGFKRMMLPPFLCLASALAGTLCLCYSG